MLVRPSPNSFPRNSGYRLASAALLSAAIAVGGGLYARDAWRKADLGVAYVAKTMCSCALVSKRPLDDCRGELPSEANDVKISSDARGVSASALGGLIERRSDFEAEFGCAPAQGRSIERAGN